MNASSWKKAADFVAKATPANLQVQVAAMAESQQLEILPLSALSVDDSGPLQVTYDSQQPIATSTPRATSTVTSETPTEAYHQVLPGMSDGLYPTLIADGLLSMHVPDNHGTLQNQLTSEVDKYLQEASDRCERDVNYFDGWHMATNTASQQQKADFVEHDEEKILELIDQDARIFSLVSAVSGPFTSRLAVCISFSWFSRSEVCAFVWGMVVRGVRVETFVRVLRSSRCRLLNNWK